MSSPSPSGVPDALADHILSSRVALTLAPADDPEHMLVLANDAVCRLTGFDREDFEGRNCRFLQGSLVDQPARGAIRAFLSGRDSQMTAQIVNVRKDGSAFVNLLVLVRLYDIRRRERFILGSQFDIGAADELALTGRQDTLAGNIHAIATSGGEGRLSMIGSVLAIGNAAGQLAQARLTLSEL